MVLALLTGACTAEPPTAPPPSLVNEETISRGVLHHVRDVLDPRTVELADGTTVRVAQLAPPADCWAEAALAFARTTLLAGAVRVDFLSGGVKIVLADGADYAQLAVRQGVLRAQDVDGGPLPAAESQAAAADLGLWGEPCNGLDLVPSPGPVPPPPPAPGATAPAPTAVVPPRPAPAPSTTVPPRPPARVCSVAYRVTGQWPGGFQAGVTVRNTGTRPVNGWPLRWTFGGGESVTGMWNATARQSGPTVHAANASYNAQLPAGGTVVIGFTGSTRGGTPVSGAFTLNDESCTAE
ncbi:cellulose-binding domain-containing protein [Lentzea chajnantorensis]